MEDTIVNLVKIVDTRGHVFYCVYTEDDRYTLEPLSMWQHHKKYGFRGLKLHPIPYANGWQDVFVEDDRCIELMVTEVSILEAYRFIGMDGLLE